MKTSLAALALICVLPALAAAGSLDAPGAPAAGSGMPTTADIYNRLDSGAAISVPGAFREPAAGPTAGTGRTLSEIGSRLPAPDNVNGATASEVASGKTFWGLRTDGTWGLSSGAAVAADIFPPGTTAAPSVSGTTDTATTLSVTIHENGTGYYLVRPASATAPTVAEVQAGTPFAMAANVPATPAISGLIFNTPYTIYFVAKDAANNVQTAAQSVAVTTLLTTGYVVQGGLTWMPVTVYSSWGNANNYCTYTTINGVTGWRMPTQAELSALYTSGAMNGKGWMLYYTWSSTPFSLYYYNSVYLDTGLVKTQFQDLGVYVSCVH